MRSRHREYLDALPAEWSPVPIRAIGDVVSGSTPSRAVPSNWNGDLPWVTPGEITGLASAYLSDTRDHLTRSGLAACTSGLLPRDTLLVTTRATVGTRALAGMPVATNQGFKSIVFFGEADPHFYYHLFDLMPGELARLASGTTFLEISGREFKEVLIPRPRKAEQRRVAGILDTIDEAIRRAEQVIGKLQQMKQGLLHDLLTRGVDEHGELRPPADEAPHIYKDSPLGRIPKGWEARTLGQTIVGHQAGIYKHRDLYGSGRNIVGVGDLFRHETIHGQQFRLARLSQAEEQQFAVRVGDLVYAESSLVLEGIAKTIAVEPGGEGTAFAWHTRRLRPNFPVASGEYLAAALNTSGVRRFVMQRATQTALTGIPVSEYLQTPVPIPTLEEQLSIVIQLKNVRTRIETENSSLSKWLALKRGLLSDLLSGRVRVPVTGESPA
jgi:type I restriction enzyme, S subunit